MSWLQPVYCGVAGFRSAPGCPYGTDPSVHESGPGSSEPGPERVDVDVCVLAFSESCRQKMRRV
jgi:hypothetical protein